MSVKGCYCTTCELDRREGYLLEREPYVGEELVERWENPIQAADRLLEEVPQERWEQIRAAREARDYYVNSRKLQPVATGVLGYFPDALLAVAEVSRVGNEQHNPGEPLHWDKSKSTDETDALARHLLDRLKGDVYDEDGVRHLAKVAWRALAALQRELDDE